MNNSLKNIRNLVLPAGLIIPFTFYFVLFAGGSYLLHLWLVTQQRAPDTSYSDIFSLLIHVGIWFIAVLLTVALITVLVSFFYFLGQKRKGSVDFTVNAIGQARSIEGMQQQVIRIQLSPLLKPFLGFIKLRLKYDGKYSEKFAIAERGQRKIISTTFEGDYTWVLPEIKEYHLEKVVVYFEDFFQFFSFTVSMPVTNRFYTPPAEKNGKGFDISPRKTEETETRIQELKRVEGEYINYKNFEDNDDVRRIVWKIYARNKELVVRIPEILDPYASQAYLYASFFNQFDITGNGTVDIYFLNYYKTLVWAIYQKLAVQGFEIRYIPDQRNSNSSFIDEKKGVEYNISTSNWQTEKDLKTYVNMKDASVVILHSLSDAEQVESLMTTSTGSTFFVLIRLSKSLQRSYLIGLVKWLFIQQEQDSLEKYRTSWQLSLLRPRITSNEKRLADMLAKYDKTIVI